MIFKEEEEEGDKRYREEEEEEEVEEEEEEEEGNGGGGGVPIRQDIVPYRGRFPKRKERWIFWANEFAECK